MTALYRLQTTLALTRNELYALAALVGLAFLGVGAQAAQRATPVRTPAPHAVRAAAHASAPRLDARVQEVKAEARAAVAAEVPVSAQDVAALLPPAPAGAMQSVPAGATQTAATEAAPEAAERRSTRKPRFTGRMNLNTATAEQLMRLPRIGEAMAQRILDYRRQHGRFPSVDALTAVRGIGDKTLALLRPHLYV